MTSGLSSFESTRNAMLPRNCFFVEFQHDPVRHANLLADRTLRCEIRKVQDHTQLYDSPQGLHVLMPEPVDCLTEPLEYMYRLGDESICLSSA
jgi:hypothetical protein